MAEISGAGAEEGGMLMLEIDAMWPLTLDRFLRWLIALLKKAIGRDGEPFRDSFESTLAQIMRERTGSPWKVERLG